MEGDQDKRWMNALFKMFDRGHGQQRERQWTHRPDTQRTHLNVKAKRRKRNKMAKASRARNR